MDETNRWTKIDCAEGRAYHPQTGWVSIAEDEEPEEPETVIYETTEEARRAWDEDSVVVLGCACGALWTPAQLKRLADADCPKCSAPYSQVGFMHGEAW
jgi:hypothetical protein